MKRSEAIKIIGNYLYELNVESEDINEESDLILSALEKAGLQAPKIKVKFINPKDYRYGTMCTMRCNCEECNPEYLVNKWEQE